MDRTTWEAAVRDAMAHDDHAALGALFADAAAAWGHADASAAWLRIFSASDGEAVTG